MLANSTAAAKKTDQPGIWEMQKSYLLNPENSKTFLILSQPKMCQKYTFLLPRAHFLGATGAPTEPVHESLLKTPILSRPTTEVHLYNYENTLVVLERQAVENMLTSIINISHFKISIWNAKTLG